MLDGVKVMTNVEAALILVFFHNQYVYMHREVKQRSKLD